MSKTQQLTVRLSKDLHEWLRSEAYEKRQSINSLINEALEHERQRTAVKDGNE